MTQYTFGPVIIERKDEPGALVAKCLSGGLCCRGYIGGSCLWSEPGNNKSRKLPIETNETPDWCQYKATAIRDAQEMNK